MTNTKYETTARPACWRTELAESLAVWMGILIVGLAAVALTPATPATPATPGTDPGEYALAAGGLALPR
jgi:hypothetical protein